MCPIDGVQLFELTPHADERGTFCELFRASWGVPVDLVQWNAVQSAANVLRGVHVHRIHHDYLTVVSGILMLGLHDLRPDSPSYGVSAMLTLDVDDAAPAVAIPPGVAHGFYFPVPAVHVYAVSEFWNLEDELGCRWDCPELGLDWGVTDPVLSARDTDAADYAALVADLADEPR